MRPHPRLSVSSLSSWHQPLEADIELWAELGIDHVALILPKIDEVGMDRAAEMVRSARLRVATIFGPTYRRLDAPRSLGWFDEDAERTVATVEFGSSVGAGSVYVCSGGAPRFGWDEAAAAFVELVAPAVRRGDALGVPLLLEPTNTFRADISFVFTQRDAVDLARLAGTKVMFDVQSCWNERDIDRVVAESIGMVAVTQLSDFVLGTVATGDRAVPGDGDIPLARLVGAVVDAGFDGPFDLEVMGPRIEAEGYRSAIRRSVERATALLDRLGA